MTGLEESVFLGGLSALPLLLALYFWRRRSRPREVGALFLWDEPVNAARSGTRFAPHLPPASFLLEALIVLLLVLAAASPFLMRKSSYPPLALIVDVSSSMDAAPPGGKSPRRAGEEHARTTVKRFRSTRSGKAPRALPILRGRSRWQELLRSTRRFWSSPIMRRSSRSLTTSHGSPEERRLATRLS